MCSNLQPFTHRSSGSPKALPLSLCHSTSPPITVCFGYAGVYVYIQSARSGGLGGSDGRHDVRTQRPLCSPRCRSLYHYPHVYDAGESVFPVSCMMPNASLDPDIFLEIFGLFVVGFSRHRDIYCRNFSCSSCCSCR